MKKRALAAAVLIVIAIALDLRRAPSAQWATAATLGGIHLYQATLSPLYARMGVQCRFSVTCSYYGEEAIKKYGAAKGGYLAAKRILRCGPWTAVGTVDPVP